MDNVLNNYKILLQEHNLRDINPSNFVGGNLYFNWKVNELLG